MHSIRACRGAHSAGIWADSLAVGTGADPVAIANLANAAEEGRRRSTLAKPIAVWAMIPVIIVDSEAELPGTREAMRMGAYASARFRGSGQAMRARMSRRSTRR